MGANSNFDERLPTVRPEAGDAPTPWRQVEVFTHGGELFLRMGQVNEENTGTNRYTVQLSNSTARKLISGIEDGIAYLNRGE